MMDTFQSIRSTRLILAHQRARRKEKTSLTAEIAEDPGRGSTLTGQAQRKALSVKSKNRLTADAKDAKTQNLS